MTDDRGGPARTDRHAPYDRVDHGAYSTVATGPGWVGTALHGAAALCSLALVVGLGVWGYGQVMRDVTGVPVVEALDGPMRVAPEAPGGQVSEHAGLSVNAVQAGGTADTAADRVRLAPDATPLAEEDLPAPELAARPVSRPKAVSPAPFSATDDRVPLVEARLEMPEDARSDRDAARAAAIQAAVLEGLAQGATDKAADETADEAEAAPVPGPGLPRSPRPAPRPEERPVRVASVAEDGTAALSGDYTAAIPKGTRLVQLGAFDSVEEARAAWGAISARFDPLLEGKDRVVQEAEAGGRTFWRLRAAGFEDLSGARRFCAALAAENADCIPVLAR